MSVPVWVEIVVGICLVSSGLLVLVAALGVLRLPDFFVRMHPPALAATLGSWLVAGAGALYFSMLEGRPALYPLLIPALLAITVPVTTVLLARVALFRGRVAGAPDVPRPLASADADANAERTPSDG